MSIDIISGKEKRINVWSSFRAFYLCLSCFGIIISGKVQKRIARGRNDQKALMTYDQTCLKLKILSKFFEAFLTPPPIKILSPLMRFFAICVIFVGL